MAKEFTKSYAINRIAELTEFAKKQQVEIFDLKAELVNRDKDFLDMEEAYLKKLNEKEDVIKYLSGIKRYDIGNMLRKNVELRKNIENLQNKANHIYPYLEEYDNGNFIEYNVVYSKNGIVNTICFGSNKEMAIDVIKSLKMG